MDETVLDLVKLIDSVTFIIVAVCHPFDSMARHGAERSGSAFPDQRKVSPSDQGIEMRKRWVFAMIIESTWTTIINAIFVMNVLIRTNHGLTPTLAWDLVVAGCCKKSESVRSALLPDFLAVMFKQNVSS